MEPAFNNDPPGPPPLTVTIEACENVDCDWEYCPSGCDSCTGWTDSTGYTCAQYSAPCSDLYTPTYGPWAYVPASQACCECQGTVFKPSKYATEHCVKITIKVCGLQTAEADTLENLALPASAAMWTSMLSPYGPEVIDTSDWYSSLGTGAGRFIERDC